MDSDQSCLHKGILRPNPNVEEDLVNHTVVTPDMLRRMHSYTAVYKKKVDRAPCSCKKVKPSPGVAPLWTMNDGHCVPSFGLGTWLGFVSKDIYHGAVCMVSDTIGDIDNIGDHTNSTVASQGTADAVEMAVQWAIDAGYRHFDTAYVYNTETQVGRAINKKMAEGVVQRSDLFITTKLWNDSHAREAVVPALRLSLKKLDLSYVDLYLIHWPVGGFSNGMFDTTDYLETWRGMVEAQTLGLTKSIGLSNFNQQMMERILVSSPVPPAMLQVEVNLNLQQSALIQYCRDQNILVTGYTPFGSLFHGKAAPEAPPPRSDERALVAMADRLGKSVPQLVLRYLAELGVIPLPKSVTKSRIEQNIAIYDWRLSRHERQILRSYERGYRTIAVRGWAASPYYPFEKA